MAKGKRGKKKKEKSAVYQKTSEDIFLEELTIIVEERLKIKWHQMDQEQKMTKKLSKADKKKLAARRAEELKVAVVEERKRLIEEEKRKQEEDRRNAIEKEARDKVEQELRLQMLDYSLKKFKKLRKTFLEAEKEDIELKEWEQYLKCDGLPDPSNCGEMNTFLHLWDLVKEETTVEDAIKKTEQVLDLLETLEEFIDCPAALETQRDDWIRIRNSFRSYQQYNLDCAAYRLLRDIDNKLNRYDIPSAGFVCVHDAFTICLWALIQLPIPTPNPKKPPRPRKAMEFEELKCKILFPKDIDVWALCVRVMYVAYDHFSYSCKNAEIPEIPKELLLNLNEVTQIEWTQKIAARADIRERNKKEIEEQIKLAYNAYQDNTENADLVQAYKLAIRRRDDYVNVDASSIYCNIEDALYIHYRDSMTTRVPERVINLRRYRILGGVFFLNLFYQPPQPTTMVLNEITLTTLLVPKWLLEVPFCYGYTPPPPPEPGVVRQPEEIEEEIRAQESEFDRMIHIDMALATNVLWLDVPVLCQWDAEESVWTTKDVHDAKHNEEKQTIQFKTGKFGPFSMAVYRYNSMPYQAWEMKPTAQGTVVLTIMAAVLIIEFTVQNGTVCVSQLQNAPNDALDSILGVFYKLPKLIRILRDAGVDLFPDSDAFCYIDGSCEKQWPLENHLYHNMGQICLFYNFAWTRWNLLAGRRKIVMQMREWSTSERAKIPNYSMLLVTPVKALIIDCTEVSQSFSEEKAEKTKFCPDLYHLIINKASINQKKKIKKAPADVINCVCNLLIATKILSLS